MIYKLITSLFLIISLLSSNLLAESTNGLKVGFIIPLSGEFAYIGEAMRKGIELNKSKLKEKNIKILIEDDGSVDTKVTLTAFRKLINIDKVDLVFVTGINSMPAITPIANKQKIPVISIWDNNRSIKTMGEYGLSMGYENEIDAEKLAVFSALSLKIKNLSIISAHDEWSSIMHKAFKDKYLSLGGLIDIEESVDLSEDDFKILISKIKARDSQAIFFPLYSKSIVNLIRKAREMNYKGELITGEGLFDQEIKDLGDLAKGIYSQRILVKNKKFTDKYYKNYSKDADSNITYAAMGYDALSIIKLVDLNKNLLKELKKVKLRGVTGEIILDKSKDTKKTLSLIRIKEDGKILELH